MKKILMLAFTLSAFFLIHQQTEAQSVLQRAKDKVKQKTQAKEDEAINKTIDSSLDESTNQTQDNSNQSVDQNNNSQSQPQTNTVQNSQAGTSVTAYQNYDFRAGDKIIFEDNFASDQDGEFPAHWDLNKGQAVVNKITDIPSFLLTDGNYCQAAPRMNSKTYLTDNFSVEYDTYMTPGAYGLIVYMYDKDNNNMSVHLSGSEVEWSYSNTKSLSGNLPAAISNENFFNKWHHIAFAYKNDQLKVYVDQYRVLTVPHCDFEPVNLDCEGIGDQSNPIIFKDFKIADGASMNIIDAIITNGKFITHGINFDVNKAALKPESMGIISEMVKYLQSHADLKLEIDGHTDSDGADAANLSLSQQRSNAVKAAIVAGGIDASRLNTKGFGESKPIGTNDTPEGKAMNRRVEFVKM